MTLPCLQERGAKRRLVLLAVVLLACFGLFTWAAYTFLPAASDTYRRQIVNDDYAALTQPLSAGGEISQRMVVKGRIYGVILNLTTFGRVPSGTLHLRLYADSGEIVAGCDADMSQLLDNTFHRFLFDVPVDAGAGAGYYLSLTVSPETDDDRLAFYRSDGPARDIAEQKAGEPDYTLADFPLFQDNEAVDGTLALQYVTQYTGASVVQAFSLFAAVLILALLLVFTLLFLFRAGVPAVFVVAAAALGFALVMLIPPAAGGQAPYIADAYHYSNLVLGTAAQDGPDTLTVRGSDAGILEEGEMDAFSWQNLAESAAAAPASPDSAVIPAQRGGAAFVLCLPQAIGLSLARLLGLNLFWLTLLPRLLNLIAYIGITVLALRRMPAACPLLAAVALLPSSLQLAASFSPGGLALAAVFYLTASCASYAQCCRRVGLSQVCLTALCAAAAALYSPVFACAALLVLAVPVRQYPSRGFAALSASGVLTLAALCGTYTFLRIPSPAAGEAGNAQWLKTLLTGAWDSGSVLNSLNWLMPLALLGLLGALAIPCSGGAILPRRVCTAAAASACLGVVVALAGAVWGSLPLALDGRALLPCLLFLAAALCCRFLRFRRDTSRTLLFWFIAVGVLVQLDAFIAVIGG